MSHQDPAAPVITVDGPSGSGKGTVSRIVAQRLGWHLLDSGALYRLVALVGLRDGLAPDDEPAHARAAKRLNVRFGAEGSAERVWLDGRDVTTALRTEQTGNAASRVAAMPAVRAALMDRQRAFARPPGLVADGRDMGTVVFPGADVKIFLTASAEERALRRHKQLEEKGLDVSLADVSQEILERDRRDSTRAVAPLRPAEGAVVIDSTGLAIEAVVDRILAVARGRLGAHATASRPQVPTVHIAAGRTDLHVVGDLWRFRELFYFLAWRDVLVRYRQTAIGIAWALLRPLLTLVVFTLVFGKLAGLPSAGIPYPILVCAALVPWQFFASALNDCSNSLLASAELLSKVYFPRLVIPGSALVVSLVDLVISMVILAGLMVAYGFMPDWRVLTLPIFVLLAVMLAFGAGLWFAALSVEFRDFRYIVPFVLQFGLFVSPVGFASAVIPEQWRLLYALNPLVGVIDGFRWALLRGEPALPVPSLALSIGIAVLLVASGLWHFRRTERKFADVI